MQRIFDDIQVIGEYDEDRLTEKLNQIDFSQSSSSTTYRSTPSKGVAQLLNFWSEIRQQPWMHTTHQFGYIPQQRSSTDQSLEIHYPGAIQADSSLKSSRINVRLDHLQIAKYPGRGIHNVLVTFAARNQIKDAQESISFSQTYRIQEGQSAGIAGYPIFIGLNAGSQGVFFECSTINVNNEADQAMLSSLESSPFQTGLELLTTAQPAITPFTTLTLGLMKAFAQRNENVPVQKFYLGLDFENAVMGIPLAEGNYIAAQVPSDSAIDWNHWLYQPSLGRIAHKDNGSSLEYNYLVFRVSRYQE